MNNLFGKKLNQKLLNYKWLIVICLMSSLVLPSVNSEKTCNEDMCIDVIETTPLGVFLHNLFPMFTVTPNPLTIPGTITWTRGFTANCQGCSGWLPNHYYTSNWQCVFKDPSGSSGYTAIKSGCCDCSLYVTCSASLGASQPQGTWHLEYIGSPSFNQFCVLGQGSEAFYVQGTTTTTTATTVHTTTPTTQPTTTLTTTLTTTPTTTIQQNCCQQYAYSECSQYEVGQCRGSYEKCQAFATSGCYTGYCWIPTDAGACATTITTTIQGQSTTTTIQGQSTTTTTQIGLRPTGESCNRDSDCSSARCRNVLLIKEPFSASVANPDIQGMLKMCVFSTTNQCYAGTMGADNKIGMNGRAINDCISGYKCMADYNWVWSLLCNFGCGLINCDDNDPCTLDKCELKTVLPLFGIVDIQKLVCEHSFGSFLQGCEEENKTQTCNNYLSKSDCNSHDWCIWSDFQGYCLSCISDGVEVKPETATKWCCSGKKYTFTYKENFAVLTTTRAFCGDKVPLEIQEINKTIEDMNAKLSSGTANGLLGDLSQFTKVRCVASICFSTVTWIAIIVVIIIMLPAILPRR